MAYRMIAVVVAGLGIGIALGAMNVRNAMALSVMVVGALLAYLRLHK